MAHDGHHAPRRAVGPNIGPGRDDCEQSCELSLSPVQAAGTLLANNKIAGADMERGIGQLIRFSFLLAAASLSLAAEQPLLPVGVIGAPAGTGGLPAIAESREDLRAHTIYRPQQMPATPLPVLVWGNGGCSDNGLSHSFFLREIASHGYFVIALGYARAEPRPRAANGATPPPPAPAPGAPRTGQIGGGGALPADPNETDATVVAQMDMALAWAAAMNELSSSPLRGHLDLTRVAVAGHSCGGLQTIRFSADPRVKTSMIFDSGVYNVPGGMSRVKVSKFDLYSLHGPTAYITGGPTDQAHPNAMDDAARIKHVPVFLGWLPVGHGGTFSQPNGGDWASIAVKWFDWQLKGDAAAGRWFVGEDCGYCKEGRWKVEFNPRAAAAPQPVPAAAQPGLPPRVPPDPRVQQRTYTFKDTNEQLPYAVFVSTKVTKARQAPLIVALHGYGGDPNTLMRANAIQAAEDGGYILVGPMGYNASGWYGAPSTLAAGTGGASGGVFMGGPPPGQGRGAGAAAPRPVPTSLGVSNDVSQRSEKDVMTVLDMIRKEFNVDEKRIYLMGHSMGGAGALYLGVKHPSIWAGIGAIAPAHAPAGIFPQNYSLAPAKNIPMIIVQGDKDPLVPVAGVRQWVDQMKELRVTHQYTEMPGGDHGSVLTAGVPEVIAFFGKHARK